MKLGKRQISILLAVIIIITIFPILSPPNATSDLNNPSLLKPHDTIYINGNSQFTKSNGVVIGGGTKINPYIIENWNINATNNTGIQIENTKAYFIIRNCYVYNGSMGFPRKNGIFFKDVKNGIVENNRITNNHYGIYLNNSDGNIISNNTCNSNIYHGIFLISSSNNTITNNIAISNHMYGILLQSSSDDNIIINNIANKSQTGILLISECNKNTIIGNIANSNWPYHGINLHDTCNENFIASNIANSNRDDGIILWINCINNLVFNNTATSNGQHGIVIGKNSAENIITNNTCNLNNDSGIYIFKNSNNNTIKNCSISSNSKYDFKLMGYCKNNIAINTSFDTIYIHDPTSKLIIKNYLHIKVNYTNGFPVQGVDLEVKDNNKTIYATPGFGGIAPKTNAHGQIKWILVTDRIYNGSAISTENITTMTVKFNDIEILHNYREVNMSTSHFENFTVNQSHNFLPNKIILTSPSNNSYINDPAPELKWAAGTDRNGDLLTYYVQVDDLDCDWNSLIISKYTGIGVLNWNISTPLMDGSYQWRVCAHDGFGNGSWSDAWKFTIETKAPKSIIKIPVDNKFYNCLNSISGTATDHLDGVGVKKVEITLKRQVDNKYWNGNDWNSNETWLMALATTNWTYDSSNILLTSGGSYRIQSRATDNLTNIEIPINSIIIYIDMDRPISKIDIPINNTNLNNLNMISGSSKDFGDSGISFIEIKIQRISDKKYWSGSKWVREEIWLLTFGANKWSYDTTLIPWTSETQYKIQSRATDNVSNIEIPSNGVTFLIDLDKPLSIIDYPKNNSYLNHLETISGNSKDFGGSGVSSVKISIKQTVDKTYWDGFGWSSIEYWFNTTGTKQWYYDVSQVLWITDTFYNIRTRAIDEVGNIEIPGPGITFMYDNKAPDISIIINHGKNYTKNITLFLSLFSEDSGSGVSQMGFSTDSSLWTDWEQIQPNKIFDVSNENGEKIIYFRVRDKANNTEVTYDKIILDTIPPYALKITINKGAQETNSTLLILNLYAIDNLSGIDKMSLSLDGINWSVWENYTTLKNYNLSGNDGKITIYFKVNDRVGNIANPVSASIILNTSYPVIDILPKNKEPSEKSTSSMVYWIFLVIIIVIVLILIFSLVVLRRKKRVKQELSIAEMEIEKPGALPTTDTAQEQIAPAPVQAQLHIINMTEEEQPLAIPSIGELHIPEQIPKPELLQLSSPEGNMEEKMEKITEEETEEMPSLIPKNLKQRELLTIEKTQVNEPLK